MSLSALKMNCLLKYHIVGGWTRLGELSYNHGQKKPSCDFCYIDIGSINNNQQKLNENELVLSVDKAPSRARKIVKFGDILYSTVRPYLHI